MKFPGEGQERLDPCGLSRAIRGGGQVCWRVQLTRQTVNACDDLGFDRAPARGADQRGRMRIAHKVAIIATIMGFGLLPMAAPALAAEATAVTVSETVTASVALQARTAALVTKTWKFAFVSPATLDRSGVEPSLYRGKFYRPSLEHIRRCIVSRESSGHYFSVSHSGKYRGAYQMSPGLARGATWMMFPEFQKILGEKAAEVAMLRLRTTPIHQWTRFWQDAAFSTVYNWEHANSGASHWRATNRGC
ncbi:MAG: hypothetical protein F2923_06880 [Actinobacteria bacterium]|uniref:Unannotated protein n=1 Tax=freshwater metagenome TaxID=449393 RepID=A0A6J7GSU7_9ZZZZ|nr:hypothetical protein [Actinomycetota bacterium]MTB28350.1 hypothetical protein [Actinomycetota bacterium]